MSETTATLDWTSLCAHVAFCPVLETAFMIHEVRGKYWGAWKGQVPPGRDTLAEAKADAEAWRQAEIRKMRGEAFSVAA